MGRAVSIKFCTYNFQYAIKSPEQKAAEEAAAAASDRTGQIGVPPGLQNMADEEAADDSEYN